MLNKLKSERKKHSRRAGAHANKHTITQQSYRPAPNHHVTGKTVQGAPKSLTHHHQPTKAMFCPASVLLTVWRRRKPNGIRNVGWTHGVQVTKLFIRRGWYS